MPDVTARAIVVRDVGLHHRVRNLAHDRLRYAATMRRALLSIALALAAACGHSQAVVDGGAGDLGSDGSDGGDDLGARDLASGPPQIAYVYVSGYSTTIARYVLDTATGALTAKGTTTATGSPSFLAIDPARRHLYAVDEAGSKVEAFAHRRDDAARSRTSAPTRHRAAAGRRTSPSMQTASGCSLRTTDRATWQCSRSAATAALGAAHVAARGRERARDRARREQSLRVGAVPRLQLRRAILLRRRAQAR